MKKFSLPVFLILMTNFSVLAQMNGTYTVCNDVSCDFKTITGAIDTLTSNTINGPVTLLLNDTSYNEQVIIPFIEGSNELNTLTIKSGNTLPGDGMAHIRYNASSINDNFVLSFDSTQNIIIDQIFIEAINLDFSTCLSISNGSKNLHIRSSKLISDSLGYTSVINDTYSDSLIISDSKIVNGNTGITFIGGGGYHINHTYLNNNEFINNKSYGIETGQAKFFSVSGNSFNSPVTDAGYTGIKFNNVISYQISNNFLYLSSGTGMELNYSGSDTSVISNNIIHISGYNNATIDKGISISNGNLQYFYYNNVVIGSQSSTASAALTFPDAGGFGSSNFIQNNNLVNFSGGYGISILDADPVLISVCNNNNLYSSGTPLTNYRGTNLANLIDWKSGTNFGVNSISVDPMFTDTSYTMNCAPELDGAGAPVFIENDLEGYPRDILTPDIGVVERNLSGWQLEKDTAMICQGETYTIDAGIVYYGAYDWSNGSMEQSIEVSDEGWYSVLVSDQCLSKSDSTYLLPQSCTTDNSDIDLNNSGIEISPNPVCNELNISLNKVIDDADILIISLEGKTVYHGRFVAQDHFNLDLGTVKSGIYILKINSKDYHYQTKFIKQK